MLRTQVELRRQGASYPGVREFEVELDGEGLRVGIVMARFNLEICEGLLAACMSEFEALGVASADIELVTVPGALEIPLVLQAMANSGRFDALVALGAVIRGDTYHFELVSNEMGAGITRVGLDHHIPVANGVLTTEDEGQARIRMNDKGTDCARAAVEMVRLLQALQ